MGNGTDTSFLDILLHLGVGEALSPVFRLNIGIDVLTLFEIVLGLFRLDLFREDIGHGLRSDRDLFLAKMLRGFASRVAYFNATNRAYGDRHD